MTLHRASSDIYILKAVKLLLLLLGNFCLLTQSSLQPPNLFCQVFSCHLFYNLWRKPAECIVTAEAEIHVVVKIMLQIYEDHLG
jgi:hypothetical protein